MTVERFTAAGSIVFLIKTSSQMRSSTLKKQPLVNYDLPVRSINIKCNLFHEHELLVHDLLLANIYDTPRNEVRGVYWNHPVRLSVCLSVCLSVRLSVDVRTVS